MPMAQTNLWYLPMKQSVRRIIFKRPRLRTSCNFCAAAGGRVRRGLIRNRLSRGLDADEFGDKSGRQDDPGEVTSRTTI